MGPQELTLLRARIRGAASGEGSVSLVTGQADAEPEEETSRVWQAARERGRWRTVRGWPGSDQPSLECGEVVDWIDKAEKVEVEDRPVKSEVTG